MSIATIRRLRVALCVLAMVVLCAACAAGTKEGAMASDDIQDDIELQGDGPFQRFIVKYRADSPAGQASTAVQPRLDRTASALQPGVTLRWERRMGIGADVISSERQLDRAQALALMRRFSADPEVEYIEVDAIMGIDPIMGPGVDD